MQLRIEGLFIDNIVWSLRRLEALLPLAPPLPPRYDLDDFRAWPRPAG